MGHTLISSNSLAEQREREIDADEFSGFILFQLGASLKQAQAPFNLISKDASDIYSTHPARSKRMLATKIGYERASSKQIIKYVKTGPEPVEFFIKGYKLTDEKRYKDAIKITPSQLA